MSELHLRRLWNFSDGVFAVSIVILVAALPSREMTGFEGDSPLAFLVDRANDISFVLIGMLLVIVYWMQSNRLLEHLKATDTKHSLLVLLQVCLLLFYLYIVSLAVDFPDSVEVLAMQSLGAALIGLVAAVAWYYASDNRRLLRDDVDDQTVDGIRKATWAEPMTALVTLPCAWLGPDIWGLSWLSYLLVRRIPI